MTKLSMIPRKPSVLVIDDSLETLVVFSKALATDFEVRTSTSGSEGLGLAIKDPPDLILLDVLMPDAHGFDVFRQFKAVKKLQGVPVMFISGLGDLDNVGQGLALGAVDYLVKPLNVNIVRQRISNLLEREHLRKEVELHRDMLEMRVAERTRELVDAKSAAEAANRSKSIFLAKMSDELRRPMNSILGMTDLALRRAADPAQLGQLETLKLGAHQLMTLINALLDISRIDSDRLFIKRHPFCLNRVIEKVARRLTSEAAVKGLVLSFEISPDLANLTLEGDAERLGQILLSFTTNAIKFSSHGSVSIRVSERESEPSDILVRLEVRDTGIGISDEDQQQLFRDFMQTDLASEGVGLGLAMCKRLAIMMGGDVGVDSALGVGSTFWADVRLFRSNQREAQPRLAWMSAEYYLKQRHASARLLLAGYDQINREVVAWMIKEAGILFDVATNDASVLQMLKNTPYDVVLIDLPVSEAETDGIMSSIRSVHGRKCTTVIAMTEAALDESRIKSRERGINDFVGKPIDAEQLFETLLTWLDNHKTGQALSEQRFQMLADIASELEGEVVFPVCVDVAIRLKQVLKRGREPFDRLLQVISLDPLISSKLLQQANALQVDPAKGGMARDIKTAARRLGEDAVRLTVKQIVNHQLMLSRQTIPFAPMAESFWKHSLHTAAAAYVLGKAA